ncbi:hypothetical protein ACFE04_009419 [Oxalis oulophora]
MESVVVGSFHRPSSLISTGGDLWSRSSTKAVHCQARVSNLRALNIVEQNLFQHTVKKLNVRSIDKRYTLYQNNKSRLQANATSGHSLESDNPDAHDSKSALESVTNAVDAFYRFSRPHTVIGTTLSIVSVSLLAVEKLSDISPLFFSGVLQAVAAALMMNIYIVGLNQLYDIDIDKSFWLGWVVGSRPLLWALSISFMLGTAYSIQLPLFRWKRFAVVAAMCIIAVRALIVQLAFFLHIQTHVFGRVPVLSRPLIFATAFMSFFSVVIALFKDIPDIVGDKIFGIQSFTVRLGQKRVFWICITLLEIAYAVAISVGAVSPYLWSKLITVLGHGILASLLWKRAQSVDLTSKAEITSFYMFIWQLFYAEYLLVPLVRPTFKHLLFSSRGNEAREWMKWLQDEYNGGN